MGGIWMENEVEVCAKNITNKTKCMSTNAKKWKEIFLKISCTLFFKISDN
jgi:hypothetical protein